MLRFTWITRLPGLRSKTGRIRIPNRDRPTPWHQGFFCPWRSTRASLYWDRTLRHPERLVSPYRSGAR